MSTLSYSITGPFLRSPVQEWQPHAKQSASTIEWWYVTTVLYDASGTLAWLPAGSRRETTPASCNDRSPSV
jgi:hypothetical protein